MRYMIWHRTCEMNIGWIKKRERAVAIFDCYGSWCVGKDNKLTVIRIYGKIIRKIKQ